MLFVYMFFVYHFSEIWMFIYIFGGDLYHEQGSLSGVGGGGAIKGKDSICSILALKGEIYKLDSLPVLPGSECDPMVI